MHKRDTIRNVLCTGGYSMRLHNYGTWRIFLKKYFFSFLFKCVVDYIFFFPYIPRSEPSADLVTYLGVSASEAHIRRSPNLDS